MTMYKLIYFNYRSRAEVIRLLFAMGETEYEDFRFERPEFPSIKPNMPFGQTPVLEVDGKQIAQSLAIERYLADKFGLLGDTSLENAQVDAAVDAIQDIRVLIDAEFRAHIPELKDDIKQRLFETKLPAVFNEFEKTILKNESQFLVGNKLTRADISLMDVVSYLSSLQTFSFTTDSTRFSQEIKKYPQILALVKRVEAVPQIADWIRKRPKTDV